MDNIILRRRKLGAVSTRGIAAASRNNLLPVLNEEFRGPVNVLFRWGCVSPMEAAEVIQPAASISLAADKAECRTRFADAGLSIPETWYDPADVPPACLVRGVVTRPAHHHQGRMVFYSHSLAGLRNSFRRCRNYDPQGRAYISEFVPKEREFRVFVIQGKVAAVAEKIHPGGAGRVAWNRARGASFHNVRWAEWPFAACQGAIGATKALNLDFAGIDIMTKEGFYWILEANAAPSLSSPYRQEVFARCFDYILLNGKAPLPAAQPPTGTRLSHLYRYVIHPALKDVEVPLAEQEVQL